MKRSLFNLIAGSVTAVTFSPVLTFAQTMPIPDGYFSHGGSIYARSGGVICGFKSPGHLQIYQAENPAPNVTVPGVTSYKFIGICPVPKAYFPYKGTYFFSRGNGEYCAFNRPDAVTAYRQYYKAPNVSELQSEPSHFMKYVKICPPPS